MHTSIRMYLAHMQLHVVYIANGLITEHERVNVHQVVACRTCKAVELLRHISEVVHTSWVQVLQY